MELKEIQSLFLSLLFSCQWFVWLYRKVRVKERVIYDLLVFVSDAGKGRYLVARSWLRFGLFWTAFHVGLDILFSNTAVLTSGRDLINVDTLTLSEESSCRCWKRLWTIYCNVLGSGLLFQWTRRFFLGGIRDGNFGYRLATLSTVIFLNSHNSVSNRANSIIVEVNWPDNSRGSRRNLRHKFVSEHLAQVLILTQKNKIYVNELTSSTRWPTFTRISLMVASLVPSPRSGNLMLTIWPNILIEYI